MSRDNTSRFDEHRSHPKSTVSLARNERLRLKCGMRLYGGRYVYGCGRQERLSRFPHVSTSQTNDDLSFFLRGFARVYIVKSFITARTSSRPRFLNVSSAGPCYVPRVSLPPGIIINLTSEPLTVSLTHVIFAISQSQRVTARGLNRFLIKRDSCIASLMRSKCLRHRTIAN